MTSFRIRDRTSVAPTMSRSAAAHQSKGGISVGKTLHQHHQNGWMDWMDQCGMELLGCDENCGGGRDALHQAFLKPEEAPPQVSFANTDFTLLHDEFLESLLYEETVRNRRSHSKPAFGSSTHSSSASTTADEDALNRSLLPSSSSSIASAGGSTLSSASVSSRKRRRPVRLSKRSSPPRFHRSAPRRTHSVDSQTVSLEDLAQPKHSPEVYVHSQCRMQKDKQKGVEVGSNICAKGLDACMEKMRAKMLLLTNHALDAKTASMKRRKARLAARYPNFVETRSLIELRMGFLSMLYGVLLRWDTAKTGKITLIVLRKQCTDSFYPQMAIPPVANLAKTQQLPNTILPPCREDASMVQDNHAIVVRAGATEVSLIEPPYLVGRPYQFSPSVLRVTFVSASGFRKSQWSAQVLYHGITETLSLASDGAKLVPKEGKLSFQLPNADLPPLEVRLLENRRNRRTLKRVVTMKLPIAHLSPQPSKNTEMLSMQLPSSQDPNAVVHLEVALISDYAVWLQQELQARRNQVVTVSTTNFWRAPFFLEEKENDDAWDWVCCVC